MKKLLFIVLLIFSLTSCRQNEQSLYESVVVNRPPMGFDRNTLFKGYDLNVFGNMDKMWKMRTFWCPKNQQFRSYFPFCNVEILAFNQTSEDKSFSWKERIMMSDALDLLIFAINSPVFEQAMSKRNFYNNDRTEKVSCQSVVHTLRTKPVKLIIGKANLGQDVLAEATVDGGVNHIWFRDDTCYALYSVAYLAMILGHEISHNMGFSHPSNVPYGIHNPILEAIYQADISSVDLFRDSTPYMEDDCLRKVRRFVEYNADVEKICCK